MDDAASVMVTTGTATVPIVWIVTRQGFDAVVFNTSAGSRYTVERVARAR